ncbi:hypothetical protein [Snodgrassella communis]|uniref:hypothetical protein n=1 Tax=Snodgrassella communis TaxID=2946699 RepID=UPI001EF62416|nr:hypothetical protein [Snodgrassella communis]
MAVLDKKLQDEIETLTDLAYEKFQNNEIEQSFKLYEQAWNLYPEPKENWNEAYNTASYVVNKCFVIKDFERAKKWLNNMIMVNNNLHLDDEDLGFYLGRYYFETGDYVKAKEEWDDAVSEAGYRVFEGKDPKYLDFYRHPEKYIKES